MSKPPIKQAEDIASSIAGAPVGIRWITAPRTNTGLSRYANIMGVAIVMVLLKSRKMGANTITLMHTRVPLPPEALQGLNELEEIGVIQRRLRGRSWLDITMSDPQMRRVFEDWDAERQNRPVEEWEHVWEQGERDRSIRVR